MSEIDLNELSRADARAWVLEAEDLPALIERANLFWKRFPHEYFSHIGALDPVDSEELAGARPDLEELGIVLPDDYVTFLAANPPIHFVCVDYPNSKHGDYRLLTPSEVVRETRRVRGLSLYARELDEFKAGDAWVVHNGYGDEWPCFIRSSDQSILVGSESGFRDHVACRLHGAVPGVDRVRHRERRERRLDGPVAQEPSDAASGRRHARAAPVLVDLGPWFGVGPQAAQSLV